MPRRVQGFFAQQGIKCRRSEYAKAFTAQEVGATSRVSGKHLAKVVLVAEVR